jgi:hypothetical protein
MRKPCELNEDQEPGQKPDSVEHNEIKEPTTLTFIGIDAIRSESNICGAKSSGGA